MKFGGVWRLKTAVDCSAPATALKWVDVTREAGEAIYEKMVAEFKEFILPVHDCIERAAIYGNMMVGGGNLGRVVCLY